MKKALLIGIDYINFNENMRLYGCINDANLIASTIIDAYDYEKKNIRMIRDDSTNNSLKPTKENIYREMDNILSSDAEEIWIHYSGHGTYRPDDDGDERDNMDEIIIPIDYETEGVISDDMFYELLNKNKNSKIILTFDCCNSGSLFDLPWRFEYENNNFKKYSERTNTLSNKNIIMFSACRDSQLAIDTWDDEKRMSTGGMTPCLIDSLRFNRFNVAIFKLFKDMCEYQKIRNREQITTLSSSNEFPTFKFLKPVILKKNDRVYNQYEDSNNSLLN